MFKKIVNNKSDLQTAVSQFIREHCEVNIPYNLDKQYIMYVATLDEFKTQRQNALFHSLLDELWKCGVSSFQSYDELRDHYKTIAGLITYKKVVSFEISEKSMIYKALKLLPLKKSTFDKLWRLLKGEIEVHHSWSEVKKDKASLAIQTLIDDCVSLQAYASSNKVKEIIDELNNLDRIII